MVIEIKDNPDILAVFVDGKRILWPIRADVEDGWVEAQVVHPPNVEESNVGVEFDEESEAEAELEIRKFSGRVSLVKKSDLKRRC